MKIPHGAAAVIGRSASDMPLAFAGKAMRIGPLSQKTCLSSRTKRRVHSAKKYSTLNGYAGGSVSSFFVGVPESERRDFLCRKRKAD